MERGCLAMTCWRRKRKLKAALAMVSLRGKLLHPVMHSNHKAVFIMKTINNWWCNGVKLFFIYNILVDIKWVKIITIIFFLNSFEYHGLYMIGANKYVIFMRLYFKHVHGAQFSIYNIYFIWFLSAVGGAVLLRKINITPTPS